MAERKCQPKLRCQFQFQFDRHVAEKMAQVYRWLAPVEPEESKPKELIACDKKNEKDRGHLRSSLL